MTASLPTRSRFRKGDVTVLHHEDSVDAATIRNKGVILHKTENNATQLPRANALHDTRT